MPVTGLIICLKNKRKTGQRWHMVCFTMLMITHQCMIDMNLIAIGLDSLQLL